MTEKQEFERVVDIGVNTVAIIIAGKGCRLDDMKRYNNYFLPVLSQSFGFSSSADYSSLIFPCKMMYIERSFSNGHPMCGQMGGEKECPKDNRFINTF